MAEQAKRAAYDLIVIGSGPAGEKGAAQAAYFGRKVALIEKAERYGGAAANTGVPGKAMRETALSLSGFRQRELHGLTLSFDDTLTVDRFMHRGHVVREALGRWIGANLDRHHIDVYRGGAAFIDANTVAVQAGAESKLLEADVILIATGSVPYRPSGIPFDAPGVYDSDTILAMERLPRSMAIVGGGAIGCEYACLFKVLGLERVCVINSTEHILPFADDEISATLRAAMESLGIEFRLGDPLEQVESGVALRLALRSGRHLDAQALLVALGRRGNVAGLELERAGVALDAQGHIAVNARFQTSVPHIYAAGDAIGGHALSSIAMEQARMAMVNAFDLKYKSGLSGVLPIGVWTIPEISMVGETEQQLCARAAAYVVGRWRYQDNPRGVLIGEPWGLLKLIFSLPDEKLLGVHVIGENACELIAAGLVGMTLGATCSTFIDTCFNYPSLSDLYKYAAYDALGRILRGEVYRPSRT